MNMSQALVATSAAAIITMSASAAFVGLSVENSTHLFQPGSTHYGANQANVEQAWNTFTSGGTDPRTVWRIYANFDNPNDFVNSVEMATLPSPALEISTGGAVYTTTVGGITAPDATLLNDPATASAAFDTFATIGVDLNNGNDATEWGNFQFDLYDMFNTGSMGPNVWMSDLDSWNVASNPAQGLVEPGGPAGYRVLLAQVTVQDGAWISGFLSGQWGSDTFALGGDPELFEFSGTFSSIVPAPGAMALFAIAGLGCNRRRRS